MSGAPVAVAHEPPAMRERLERAFLAACRLDVESFKPGNVSLASPGHGMRAEDFLDSARAAAQPLCAVGAGVGARILAAVRATRAAVGCNTNLGIVLLAAPLLAAAERRRRGEPLRAALSRVLAALDREDAALAYRAIVLANPAGLGRRARHDVRQTPQIGLRQAMAEAAREDLVARQYVSDYASVWDLGLPTWHAARARGARPDAALVEVYLAFLAAYPDSHVRRKHGARRAAALRRAVGALRARLALADERSARATLETFDRRLKRGGINPGTSADLAVTTALAAHLENVPAARAWGAQPR
ncbi:MAG: triphosphoribosyl-dephospho-CoA synthase [Sinobacteraceae bacterium]|nr:triphosphoribosyl-dephospho-CoA synthase [Nevskiaceae bacterium]